jgi:hypothetical protein
MAHPETIETLETIETIASLETFGNLRNPRHDKNARNHRNHENHRNHGNRKGTPSKLTRFIAFQIDQMRVPNGPRTQTDADAQKSMSGNEHLQGYTTQPRQNLCHGFKERFQQKGMTQDGAKIT